MIKPDKWIKPDKCNGCKYQNICKPPYSCKTFDTITDILKRIDSRIQKASENDKAVTE